MRQYEFQVIGGDGARFRHERHSLSDLKTVWDRVLVMAGGCEAPGSQVRVLDEDGGVVLGIGLETAHAIAKRLARSAPARSIH